MYVCLCVCVYYIKRELYEWLGDMLTKYDVSVIEYCWNNVEPTLFCSVIGYVILLIK
jgi:hypothetical protein